MICWNGGVFATTPGRLLQRLLPVMVLACAGVVLAQVPAQAACRCVQSDVRTDIKRADAVFSGIVVESSGTSGSKNDFASYQVKADTLYKGDVRTSSLEVRSQNDDCGLGDLKADRRYVFFVTEDGSQLRTDRCSGTAPSSSGLIRQIEQELGEGSPLGRSKGPSEPVTVAFTRVTDAEPDSLTRTAAPGAALVLVGLLGLLVVRRVRD